MQQLDRAGEVIFLVVAAGGAAMSVVAQVDEMAHGGLLAGSDLFLPEDDHGDIERFAASAPRDPHGRAMTPIMTSCLAIACALGKLTPQWIRR